MKPEQLDGIEQDTRKQQLQKQDAPKTESLKPETRELIGDLSERELVRQHVERSQAFQRRLLRELDERCDQKMAEIKAALAAR